MKHETSGPDRRHIPGRKDGSQGLWGNSLEGMRPTEAPSEAVTERASTGIIRQEPI